MQIQSSTSLISFQKRFMANAIVLQDSKPLECKIFEVNEVDDKDYFINVQNDAKWKKAVYLDEISEDFPYNFPYEKIYTLENKKEECLGYLSIDVFDPKKLEVNLLETCPAYSIRNNKRGIQNIGQELIKFLVGLAKEKNVDAITVPIVADSAFGFYEKCGFKTFNHKEADEEARLEAKDFDSVLKK